MGWFGKAGENVISMSGYRGETGFRALNVVEAYWESLRRGRVVPRRSDIDPRGIENALEYAFILEKIAPGLARLRIAGMHLSDLMGMEVRGMPVSAFLPPSGRTAFSETLEAITMRPAVARISLSAEDGIGKPPLEGRMLLLPLESDFGEVSRVLGCFETRGQIGRAPRRFNVIGTELRQLQAEAIPAPAPLAAPVRRSETTPPETAGLAEAPAVFRPQRGSARGESEASERRPDYLRLVKSDD